VTCSVAPKAKDRTIPLKQNRTQVLRRRPPPLWAMSTVW
jgi:hypothetical protein